MNADKKIPPQQDSASAEEPVKKPWVPMKLTLAGDAKDVIRHGIVKTSPGVQDPGDVLKIPGQAEH